MRLVAQLPEDVEATRSRDNKDTLNDLTETERSFESLSNYLTENKMAAVFPALSTSGSVDLARDKIIGCPGSQIKPEQLVNASEPASGTPDNGSAVRSSRGSARCLLPRDSNTMMQYDPANGGSQRAGFEKQDYINPAEHFQSSKGGYSSRFQDKVVTACIEQQNIALDGAPDEAALGSVKNCHSLNVETPIASERDTIGRELLQHSMCNSTVAGETKSQVPSNHSWSSDGMSPASATNTRVPTTSDTTDPTVGECTPLRQVKNVWENPDVPGGYPNVPDGCPNVSDGCPDVLLLPEQAIISSAADCLAVANSECDKTHTQKTDARVGVANGYDVITSEAMSRSPEPGRKEAQGSLDQHGGRKPRKGLSARISHRFLHFFQKHPKNAPAFSDPVSTDDHSQCSKASEQKDHGKKATRKSSFTGRVMTSISEWRRKPTSQDKKLSRKRNKKNSDIEDTNEAQNNNTGRVPIFVSPEDQAEIVEDAPIGIKEDQKTILRGTWLLIKSDVEQVGVETFMGLFHTHPDSIDSFLAFKDKAVEDIEQSAVLKAHALRVMQTVDKCITRLDDVDKMAAILCQLGRRHVGYKANARLVPMIGKQFISAIEPKIADKWSDEVCKAWEVLFATINYNLRRGMMQEKHRLHDEAVTRGTK
ncbi:hypothetical protein BsWGS_26487 [Bradybaena similaris]